jgi:FtsH-binding integral membrane protein
MDLAALAGWIPAVIFPTATSLQLIAMLRARSAKGVSIVAWLLFALANLCLYFYMGRYAEPQAILSGLLTATLNLAIVVAALLLRQRDGA